MPTGVLSYAIGGAETPIEEIEVPEEVYEGTEAPVENEVAARLEPVQATSFTVNASPETSATTYTAYPNDFTTTIWGGDTNFSTISNPAYTTYTIHGPEINYSPFVRACDLEKFFKRIYKVISDHTTINVTEEEFLKLIQEDDKDGTDD